jgi:hypothetical protein
MVQEKTGLSPQDRTLLTALDDKLRTVLPEEYQDSYEEVKPVSMGSAGLKYDPYGNVAWNEIWGSFCDLAMAGGPPHKGALLEPASPIGIAAEPDKYREVAKEICRGLQLVAGLPAEPSPTPGWIEVECDRKVMAGWLTRAIVMENVSGYTEGTKLYLPAGPHFRLEKEIKNVITVIAKTCHYFVDHMWVLQQRHIDELFKKMEAISPLVQPALAGFGFDEDLHATLSARIEQAISQRTGLRRSAPEYAGWLGLQCSSVQSAIWMMRALVVSNVVARREGTILFVPVNPQTDPSGELVAQAVIGVHRLAELTGRA